MKTSETITLGVGDLSVNGQDVGYLGGEVTVTTNIEKVDFTHGTHKTLVKRFLTTLERSIKAKLAQIDIDTLKMALGIGEIAQNGDHSRLNFGRNWTLPTLSNVKFVHTRDDGKKVTVFFPKAQVEPGTSELTFSNENVIMQDITISAVEDPTREDCPMGFIMTGPTDDTVAWSGGNPGDGGGGDPITPQINTVTDETVTYSADDPHYSLEHGTVMELLVKSADGNTTYAIDDDYTYDNLAGNIFVTEDSSIPEGTNLKVDYKYVNNAVVETEQISMDNGQATLAHQPLYSDEHVVIRDDNLTYKPMDDYTVDLTTGTISIVSGGSLPAEATVSVTYAYLVR